MDEMIEQLVEEVAEGTLRIQVAQRAREDYPGSYVQEWVFNGQPQAAVVLKSGRRLGHVRGRDPLDALRNLATAMGGE